MSSHNGREPGPKGLLHVSKDVSRALQVHLQVRVPPKFPLAFWNHYSKTLEDPEFPRTSNMVGGFHRGFKSRVNRPKPTVQEYFRTIREQQVIKSLIIISIDWVLEKLLLRKG